MPRPALKYPPGVDYRLVHRLTDEALASQGLTQKTATLEQRWAAHNEATSRIGARLNELITNIIGDSDPRLVNMKYVRSTAIERLEQEHAPEHESSVAARRAMHLLGLEEKDL